MPGHLTITGVCGWAIPPAWFEEQIALHFPEARVRALYPENPADDGEASRLIEKNPARLWIGYSLGSLWLVRQREHLPPGSVLALLCPIPGFTHEMGRGGKTRRVQLQYLIKQLGTGPEPLEPVARFYRDLELPLESWLENFPVKTDSLIRGLDFLATAEWDKGFRPAGHFLIGKEDPLMTPSILAAVLPDLVIVPGAGHHPGPLLARLSEAFVE